MAAQVKDGLDRMQDQFRLQLPAHITPERFVRVIMTAVNADPSLLDADRRSLYSACLRAASDGLLPDKREGALVIFKDRSGKKIVQWLAMVFGLIKLARQSGEIDSIGARIVYQNEIDQGRFSFIFGEGKETLHHEPILWGQRGEPVLVYAYARHRDSGLVEYETLHIDDVMKRKAMSRSPDGPWKSWRDEMWKKSAIRALAKKLPVSQEILNTMQRVDEPTEFSKQRDEAVRAAHVQLGAPVEPETEPEPVVAEVLEPLPDITEIASAEMMVNAAIDALDPDHMESEGNTVEDLETFADQIRDNIRGRDIPDDAKVSLLDRFQTVVLDKQRTLLAGKK
jgi:recombination protein RecT